MEAPARLRLGAPASLALGSYNETSAWIRPAIEFGKVIPLEAGAQLRLHAELAYQYFFAGDHTDVTAGFTGAPRGVAPMEVPVDLGSMASITLGADLLLANDITIGLDYTKAFDDNFDLDSINLKLSTSF